MVSYYRPTRVEISLDALNRNLRAFRSAMPEGRLLMASVKANAYGHGAVEVAREAERFGVDYLGVAFLDEALQLRQAGIATPILVLGFVPADALEIARDEDITIALFRADTLEAAAALPAHADGKKLKVHIKIDTGMGRLGIIGKEQAIAFIHKALAASQLEVEGLFTHYAKADETDKSYTGQQYERFYEVAEYIRSHKLPIRIIHAANSAAGIDTPEYGGDMVRLGISMYGLYPSDEVSREKIKLDPVLSLKTEVVMVKDAPPGWGISYGTRYVTKQEEKIGTLPIGYADGFSRMLTGKANVLVRGVKVPVLGTICMDQCMIALDAASAETAVEPGEEVVLIGRQGQQEITAGELASQLGTINYEVTCMVAARVPRVYVRDGQVIAVSNPLVLG
ncbi:alanine racemase [Paenibacillus glycanilyticus]|uniref:Alanine racemase n=1 Tax=Paenibacillus glycanilyticus TaxID=126569 RepID=A0ABQ6GBD4_9BACL|nr:alanine racemase [Paenibacillus glycanilyticus]GLX66382.1 alanine racemase [Paenibacillus glycanilyticus]